MDSTFAIAAVTLVVLALSVYVSLIALSPVIPRTGDAERNFTSATSPRPTLLPRTTPSQEDASLSLSVIVPAFNEQLRIGGMLDEALAHLAKTPSRTFEVIVIDDGSTDDTTKVALQFSKKHRADSGADIRVVRLLRNRGKGGAVQHGMLHARGARLLMVDADGASRFSDIDDLWAALDALESTDPAKKGRAVAVGSRAHLVGSEAVVQRSAIRNALMYSFHFILKTLGVGHIRDTQCGFKLFTRPAAYQLFSSQHLPTWIFDVEILLLARQLRIPVAEVAVHWHEVAGSKLRLISDSVGMLRDLLVLRANYATGRWRALPLK